MKFTISATLITFFLFISGIRCYGQQNYATNVKTEISDDKMFITYDAPPRDGIPFYTIILMITYNGKAVQAKSVYGDYEGKVEPGTEKSITWYYSNDFKEDIRKVSVSVYAYKITEPKVYFEIISKSNNGYAPCDIKVSNSSSNVNEYKWDFGDPESGINNTSTEKEPVHVYQHEGIYKISLTGRNSVLGLEETSYNTVEIKAYDPTVADFTFIISPASKSSYEVKFTSTSQNADILVWNFNDPGANAKNNTSDKPNPVYKYKQPGTYMVELTAKSLVSGLSHKVTKEVIIRAPLNPEAAFVYSLSRESAPAIAQFKNTSTNAVSFKWTFGDDDSGTQNTSTETDPAHNYLKPGTFEVVLVASDPASGKSKKYSEMITVQGPPKPPVAGFIIGNNNVIGPVTIIFTNTSTDADFFTWDFGDPGSGMKNTSNESSPIHTFVNPGRYTVVLKTASSKTSETSLYTDYVNVIEPTKPPVARFTIDKNNLPFPANISFRNSTSNATLFVWNFGDPASGANTSAELNPSHLYNKAGKYAVTLTAKNNAGTVSTWTENVVIVEPAKPPEAKFTVINNNSVSPANVSFSNGSTNAVQYSWNFGDPASGANVSIEANPSHLYSKAGKYTVTLTAKNISGVSSNWTEAVMIAEPARPAAKFTIDNNNAINPATVSFSNSSTNATQYSWNFGDPASGANVSTDANPSHLYNKAGKYTVTLTAKNSAGAVSTWTDNVVIVEPAKPVAKFAIVNNNVICPASVSFTNASSNAVQYSWNFGDPTSGANTSAEFNPSHLYSKAGKYAVVLTAKNGSGALSTWTENVFIVEPVKPVAKFVIENNNAICPATISFTNASANAVQYTWNFGDQASGANTSADPNPSHLYSKAGKYIVTLTIKSSSGIESTWTDNVVIVEPAKPVAKFTIENNNAICPATVRFTNASANAVQYSWNFGDPDSGANTSTDPNPSHLYSKAGKYAVILTAKSVYGAVSTWTENVFINEPAKPTAKFTIENNNAICPATVSFSNASVNAVEYTWNFGDPASVANISTDANPSHIYSKSGKYLVTLTAKNSSGVISTSAENVMVNEPEKPPVAKFNFSNNSSPAPAIITFENSSTNASQISWNFGDPASGANTSTEPNPSHIYSKAGKYIVSLTAKNNSGVIDTWSENVTVVEPEIIPTAQFTIRNNNAFTPASVSFSNTSANAVSYSWDFGDPSSGANNTSTDTNPAHIYSISGRYQVSLTVKSSTGTSRIFSDFVTVVEPPKPPLPKFTIENNNVIGPATVSFSNTSENADLYKWNFGDPESGMKNTSEDFNPVHTYFKPGSYTVRLTASEKLTGQTKESESVVTILEPLLPPEADFDYSLNGKYAPLDVSFSNKSKNGDIYKWSFGEDQPEKNESSGTNPVHRYEKPGSYTVTLEAKNTKSGKTHTAIKEITIDKKYITFLKTFGKRNSDETATCLLSPANGQYVALINEQKEGSTIVTFDKEGAVFLEKKLNNSIFDILVRPDSNGYFFAGIGFPNDLIVQIADKQMNPGNPTIVYSNVYDPGFRFLSLHTALSNKNEVGIVANLVNDSNETNIWFQKIDASGKPVIARGKSFKYPGLKTANRIIPTGAGEFVLTGSYQDKNSLREMMLGIVSNDGTGKIKSLRAKQNLTGCDMIELPDGNFEMLAVRESPGNPYFSEVNVKLIDREINSLNSGIELVGLMQTSELRLFPPKMIVTHDGYIILTHIFNGTDHDIALFWIDKSGTILQRKEEIKRPGDQFGTGIIRESDGSLVITGAERTQGDLDAIIIKTDRQGKYSDTGNE